MGVAFWRYSSKNFPLLQKKKNVQSAERKVDYSFGPGISEHLVEAPQNIFVQRIRPDSASRTECPSPAVPLPRVYCVTPARTSNLSYWSMLTPRSLRIPRPSVGMDPRTTLGAMPQKRL